MKQFLERIKRQAKENPKRIVFAEGTEPRVVKAAQIIRKEGFAIPILLINPEEEPHFESYAQEYAKLRELPLEEAREAMKKPHHFATMMVQMGDADGMIAGPTAASKERILPAFQIIKTKEKGHKASAFFFMVLPKTVDSDAANGGILLFADCAVNVQPTPEELANIAIDTAESAKRFGLEPKIAMLSFSTAGSSDNPEVKEIQKAAALVMAKRPDLKVSKDMQVDAALMDAVGEIKAPHSAVAGDANVLIFPDLEAGNIGYKLVERLAGAKAIGPILQGLNKPINELSRGCNTDDIVNLTAITSLEANFPK